jgi:hypothetical protein
MRVITLPSLKAGKSHPGTEAAAASELQPEFISPPAEGDPTRPPWRPVRIPVSRYQAQNLLVKSLAA